MVPNQAFASIFAAVSSLFAIALLIMSSMLLYSFVSSTLSLNFG